MTKLQIDPEFHALIPPLSTEERQQLEANLQRDGCRDPLVVWNGLLLDGHNRFEICTANKWAFRTVEQICADRDDAKIWIIRNQFGRRNLAPYVRAELALKLEPLISARARERQVKGGVEKVPQNSAEPSMETRQEVAKIAGVSHDTIDKVRVIAAKASEAVKEKLRRSETSINREHRAIVGVRKKTPRAASSQRRRQSQETHFDQALAEARAWMGKWGHLSALAPICDAITKLVEEARV